MTQTDQEALLKSLRQRFEKNMERHKGLEWSTVTARLEAKPGAIRVLAEMERTGGEPDVIGYDGGTVTFCDCSAESPTGRRSICFDRRALDSRKENKPMGNAEEMAAAIGIELLSEVQYRQLQALGAFDQKTSSWVQTPPEIRKLGGALFCDRRYGVVFVYHNGAESYYAARGFRGRVVV
jgi:hypothetical protein